MVEEKKQIKTSTGILIILAAAVIIGGGAIAYFYAMSPTSWDYMGSRTSVHKNSNKNANANTNANVDTVVSVEAWKNYTNSKYGFTMTFPEAWKGYKVFEVTLSDGSIVLYVTVPTTDASWQEEKIDAGYASLFAISVLTPEQWAEVQAAGGPMGAYITKNSQHVFIWSPAQAAPIDLIDKYNKTLKPADVVATFEMK